MPVDLSIKQVPDQLADRLRDRAKRNHRSLQGELRAILEAAVGEPESPGVRARERSPEYGKGLDVATRRVIAPRSEAALMIREDRDGRTFTVQALYDYVAALGDGTPKEAAAWIRQTRLSR